jgi:small subunit ribosomal protein S15
LVKRRAHAHGKSHSIRPISRKAPPWCRFEPEEVEALVIKLGKDMVPPSLIGTILRDQYGIPLVKQITGKSVTQILKENNLAPSVPSDLASLLAKAVRLARHLERHKADSKNKHALQLLEAKIHNLSRYYKRTGQIPKDWEYKAIVLSAK